MPSTGAERQRRYIGKLRARAERADRLEQALAKILDCYDRNWQRQREKLDDIVPMARRALEDRQ